MLKRVGIILVFLLLAAGIAMGGIPQSSFSFKDFFNLTGALQIESNQYCIGTDCVNEWDTCDPGNYSRYNGTGFRTV